MKLFLASDSAEVEARAPATSKRPGSAQACAAFRSAVAGNVAPKCPNLRRLRSGSDDAPSLPTRREGLLLWQCRLGYLRVGQWTDAVLSGRHQNRQHTK